MADVSIAIAGLNVSFTLSDADAGRILAAHTALFTTQDGDGTPVVPTPQDVVIRIAQGVVGQLAQTAVVHEQQIAANAAAMAVPGIDATINEV